MNHIAPSSIIGITISTSQLTMSIVRPNIFTMAAAAIIVTPNDDLQFAQSAENGYNK